MSTNNICFYKEVDKVHWHWILKASKLLDCVLIGACVVIKLSTVYMDTG